MADCKCSAELQAEIDTVNALLDSLEIDVSNAIAKDIEQDSIIAELKTTIENLPESEYDIQYNGLVDRYDVMKHNSDVVRYHVVFWFDPTAVSKDGIRGNVIRAPQQGSDARAPVLTILQAVDQLIDQIIQTTIPQISQLFSDNIGRYDGLIETCQSMTEHYYPYQFWNESSWVTTDNPEWKWNSLLHMVEPWWQLCTYGDTAPIVRPSNKTCFRGVGRGTRTSVSLKSEEGVMWMLRTLVPGGVKSSFANLTENSTLPEILGVAKEIKRDLRSRLN